MISVVVPCLNRSHYWPALFASLEVQTCKNFEVVIADDGSRVDELNRLVKMLPRFSFPYRLYALKEHPQHKGDSLLADQVLFREAQGDTIVHLDDDGWVHEKMVEEVFRVRGSEVHGIGYFAAWGEVRCVNVDRTVKRYDPRTKLYPSPGLHRMPRPMNPHEEHAKGSVWMLPTALIRHMGGHDMMHVGFRGCDSRLGHRLLHSVPCYFLTGDPFAFWHHGLSYYASESEKGNNERIAVILKTKAPVLRTCDDIPAVCNGGDHFWDGGFPIPYERVL